MQISKIYYVDHKFLNLISLISEPLWLYMNAHSNELELSISKVSSKDNLKIDCTISVHCVFQRVK